MVRDQTKEEGLMELVIYVFQPKPVGRSGHDGGIEQLSEKNNAINFDVMERDVAPLDLSRALSISSTGSEASWKSEETINTKPVAVCLNI